MIGISGRSISFIRYIGGKVTMAKEIRKRLHATGRSALVDVFGGSAAVILNAGFQQRVYNDIDNDLVNLFRVMANPITRADLLERLRWSPPSRGIFMDDYENYKKGGLSFRLIENPVERARATFYRGHYAFGGKMRSGGFQVTLPGDRRGMKEANRLWAVLESFHKYGEFFRQTVIENLDFKDLIALYGGLPSVVFFVDPPYPVIGEIHYSHYMNEGQHSYLAHALASTPAPAVATFYDCELVRDLYPESRWIYEIAAGRKNAPSTKVGTKRSSCIRIDELILTKRMG